MKKIIFVLLLSLSLFLSSLLTSGYTKELSIPQTNIKIKEVISDVDYIEYICTDSQWYQIIHYTDGSIGVTPVFGPPFD